MKKLAAMLLVVAVCVSMVACGGADKVVRYDEHTADGMTITTGYNKDDVVVYEKAVAEDGSVYEHWYDTDGNQIKECATLPDGSYHEFEYDKAGNVTKETHK